MQSVAAAGLEIGPGEPTRIMGVLNVSAESPYDPSVYTDPVEAAGFVDDQLIGEGADIVDVGLESANKRFEVLSEAEELDRLPVALETIEAVEGDAVWSIETRYAAVAEAALDAGFDMVNDICGFADPDMAPLAREREVPMVKMAGPGDLERPGALTSVDEIYEALAGEPLPDETIVDPAFGGWAEDKTEEIDRETFDRLSEFRGIGQPILVSINRKNFLRHLADRSTEEALPVSLAATSMAIERGADVVRTHDVAETVDAAVVADTFTEPAPWDADLGVRALRPRSRAELGRHLDRVGAARSAVADGRTHAFEMTGLDTVDATLLAHLATDVGGQLVEGSDARHVLMATERQLRQLREAIQDESEELAASLEWMVEATR